MAFTKDTYGINQMELGVRAQNQGALRSYEKIGFVETKLKSVLSSTYRCPLPFSTIKKLTNELDLAGFLILSEAATSFF